MSSTARSSGIGMSGGLFILFLALRLTDQIDWAWYWVAAPLWMPVGAVLAVIGVLFVVDGVSDEIRRRRRLSRAADRLAAERSRKVGQ